MGILFSLGFHHRLCLFLGLGFSKGILINLVLGILFGLVLGILFGLCFRLRNFVFLGLSLSILLGLGLGILFSLIIGFGLCFISLLIVFLLRLSFLLSRDFFVTFLFCKLVKSVTSHRIDVVFLFFGYNYNSVLICNNGLWLCFNYLRRRRRRFLRLQLYLAEAFLARENLYLEIIMGLNRGERLLSLVCLLLFNFVDRLNGDAPFFWRRLL